MKHTKLSQLEIAKFKEYLLKIFETEEISYNMLISFSTQIAAEVEK